MILKSFPRAFIFSTLSGFLAGLAAAVFLILLDLATRYREAHHHLVLFLPLAGLLIGLLYFLYGKDVAGGNNLILDEIHDPKKITPFRMAPFILFGTVFTHLFGGSAGREGTAVQMGASLSDQIGKFFTLSEAERRALLMAGAGAGFGAAIGTPWAGVVFGLEVIEVGKIRFSALFECLIASFVGYYTTHLLHAPHSHYPRFEIGPFNLKIAFFVCLAGILFGLVAQVFAKFTHGLEKIQNRFISYPPLKPLLGGLLLVLLYYYEGSFRYTGLGIPVIQDALTHMASLKDPLFKAFFTSITLASGFKGGEFIPLVFIGCTLGSALALFIPVSFQLLGAVGFCAVFGGAANTPLACTVMAMEIFGYKIGPYAILACFVSYLFSGHHGIYKTQRIYMKKHERFLGHLKKPFLMLGLLRSQKH